MSSTIDFSIEQDEKFYERILTTLKGLFAKPDISTLYGKKSWAIVTRPSNEIGKTFCEELAKQGLGILLLDQDKKKIQNIVNHLRDVYPNVRTKAIIADFKQSLQNDFFDEMCRDIEDFDVSILVNNVGIEPIGSFGEFPEKLFIEMIVSNTVPTLCFTKNLIGKFERRKKKYHSAIINISLPAINLANEKEGQVSSAEIILFRPEENNVCKVISHEVPFSDNQFARNLIKRLTKNDKNELDWSLEDLKIPVIYLPGLVYNPLVRNMKKKIEKR